MFKRRSFCILVPSLALAGALALFFTSCSPKNKKDEQNVTAEASAAIQDGSAKIPVGLRAAGVDLSGQTLEEARAAIESAAAAQRANVSVTLAGEGKTWTLSADDLGLTADIDQTMQQISQRIGSAAPSPEEVALVWKTDATTLTPKLDAIALEVNAELVEPSAEYTPNGPERFAFTEGIPGKQLDVAALSANIQGALHTGQSNPSIELAITTTQPTKTVEEIKANLVKIVVCNTSFSGNSNSSRVTNLQLGASKINGVLVKPGREFSFNDIVGPRDAKNGWQLAATIVGGNTFEDDYGGGICQISTTLYNAVLKADLKISKRNKHSIPSSYVPYGLDATVAYGSKDFKFVNNTDYPIYIFASVDMNDQKVYVSVYGRPLPDNKSIKLRSTTLKELDPDEAERISDPNVSAGNTTVDIKERKGYTVKVTKEYVVNDKVVETVDLYTDTYAPVRGRVIVGSAGAVTPSNPSADAQIPEEIPSGDAAENPPDESTETPADSVEDEPASVNVTDLEPGADGAFEIPDEEE